MIIEENKPQLRVTANAGNVPVRGICSACPNVVFDTGARVGKREDHERKLNELFAEHFKKNHGRENKGEAA